MPSPTSEEIQRAVELALHHHRQGDLAGAENLYRRILAVQPNHPDALHLLGVIALQVGDQPVAIELIGRSIANDPTSAAAHSNLGEALRLMGRLDEAAASCRRALELAPDFFEAHLRLGNTLQDAGELPVAIGAYEKALALQPDSVTVRNNLGVALTETGREAEAIEAYRRALELDPLYFEAHTNLGTVLARIGQTAEAVAAFRRALEIQPAYAEAHNGLGNALRDLHDLTGAIAAYGDAIRCQPDYAEAYSNLGGALGDHDRNTEAVAACRQAIALNPTLAPAYLNLGHALRRNEELDEALRAYEQALEIDPVCAEGHAAVALIWASQGRPDAAVAADRRSLAIKPEQVEIHSNLICGLLFDPQTDREAIEAARASWNKRFGATRRKAVHSIKTDDPGRRLRIGYVSPDFREHVIGRNVLPLVRQHERRHFEVVCYSGATRADGMTQQFQQQADQWRNTAGVSDEAFAAMVEKDQIDILVDLTQHLEGNRLPVFAQQPAPVQVSFAGYPESTGLEAIGYRISDRWLEAGSGECGWKPEADLPSANSEQRSSGSTPQPAERVFLIDSFWCYDPCGMDVPAGALPARENGFVTFGCLNNFGKVNDVVLKLWARVLREVQGSRLVLLTKPGSHRERTLDFLADEGLVAERIEFVAARPRQDYLKLYHRLDVMLDTFPYCGHTTSLDALWMGVPVVSMAGETAVSRGGLSILNNLGLPELVTFEENEFVRIATDLAHDLPRLADLRATLRARMESSVLMDAPRFARQIEDAYRAMFREWCGLCTSR